MARQERITFREWCNHHKGVRRLLVGFCSLWGTGVVAAGIYYLPELTEHGVKFIREVLIVVAIPIAWYFYQRGKDQ